MALGPNISRTLCPYMTMSLGPCSRPVTQVSAAEATWLLRLSPNSAGRQSPQIHISKICWMFSTSQLASPPLPISRCQHCWEASMDRQLTHYTCTQGTDLTHFPE